MPQVTVPANHCDLVALSALHHLIAELVKLWLDHNRPILTAVKLPVRFFLFLCDDLLYSIPQEGLLFLGELRSFIKVLYYSTAGELEFPLVFVRVSWVESRRCLDVSAATLARLLICAAFAFASERTLYGFFARCAC